MTESWWRHDDWDMMKTWWLTHDEDMITETWLWHDEDMMKTWWLDVVFVLLTYHYSYIRSVQFKVTFKVYLRRWIFILFKPDHHHHHHLRTWQTRWLVPPRFLCFHRSTRSQQPMTRQYDDQALWRNFTNKSACWSGQIKSKNVLQTEPDWQREYGNVPACLRATWSAEKTDPDPGQTPHRTESVTDKRGGPTQRESESTSRSCSHTGETLC